MGIIINHYKDPYQPTSIMESKRVCFMAQVNRTWGFLVTLVFQMPGEHVFWVIFWGPNTSSQGVWKPRVMGNKFIYLLLLLHRIQHETPAFRMKAGNNSNTKIFRTQGESPRYHRDVLCTKRRQQLASPSTCEANMEKTWYLGKIIVYI